MGVNPNKTAILQILEDSIFPPIINNQNNYKLESKINYIEDSEDLAKEEIEKEDNSDDSFDFLINQELNNSKYNVKNIKKFPFSAIGTINVQFPGSDEVVKLIIKKSHAFHNLL